MYEILFSPVTEKYFKKLKEKALIITYKEAIQMISKNPYIGQIKTGDLAGIYGYDLKYKGSNYEIAYTINESNGKKVVIILAGSRENFYDQLKRYIK